jgi:glc operon protein GlcG
MIQHLRTTLPLVMLLTLCPVVAFGQAYMVPPSTPYGMPITLESAKKAAAGALAEARKNGWLMAAAVVDTSGNLVYFEKMDNVQNASSTVAIEKATSSAVYKRPTKVFLDALAAGGQGWRTLALSGAIPVEGGIPLAVDGKIVGAIGLSGGAGDQDSKCAEAGAAALASR